MRFAWENKRIAETRLFGKPTNGHGNSAPFVVNAIVSAGRIPTFLFGDLSMSVGSES